MVHARILDENLGTELPACGPLFSDLTDSIAPYYASIEGHTVQGGLEVHPLRRGMTMWVFDLNVREDIKFDWKISGPGVGFCVVLSGISTHTVCCETRGERSVECRPGQYVIEGYHTQDSHVHLSGGHTHRAVEVHIDTAQTGPLLDEWQVSQSGPLRHLLLELTETPGRLSMNLVPAMEAVAYQVVNCPMTGPARTLFMQSKALEILAHQFAMSSGEESSISEDVPKAELDQLHQAREILTTEFADPPSLIQLAHRVGLNEFKLKRGFRLAFGTTVYGYVRSLRMHKARALLESGERTVTDVAAAIGYRCFGHFSAAFRKQFGILPREVKGAGTKRNKKRSSVAVGMPVARHPPHRSVQADFPHTAPTLGERRESAHQDTGAEYGYGAANDGRKDQTEPR